MRWYLNLLLVLTMAFSFCLSSSFSQQACGQSRSASQQKRVVKQQESKRTKKNVSLFNTLADIKAFSKRMDAADNSLQRTEATVDLASLYLRIVGDSRFLKSERLQGFRGRVAARLRTHQKQIVRARKKAEKASGKSKRDMANVSFQAPVEDVEGMQSAVVDPHWRLLSEMSGSTGPSMYYGSGMYGTAGYFWRGQAGGQQDDNGDELVDLIEAILHPDFWQANGGPGVLYYYQPLRILVVRATTTVHEDLEDFLERLR